MVRGVRGHRGHAIVVSLILLTCLVGAGTAAGTEAAYPGANGLIVFRSNGVLTLMRPDGTGMRRIEGRFGRPSWSPNGAQISLYSGGTQITIVRADGSYVRQFSTSVAAYGGISWAPDAQRLAFGGRALTGGKWDVYLINVDGTGETRLTTHEGDDLEPDWSPDGTRIAFERDFNLYVMNADGSGAHQIVNGGSSPDWSPDGTHIVYRRLRLFFPNIQNDIYVVSPDGSVNTGLTNDPAFDTSPAWSPDGTRIAFSKLVGTGNDYEIFVMNADGSGQTNVTRSPVADEFPDWQPLVPDVGVTQSVLPRTLTRGRTGTVRVVVRGSGTGASNVRLTVALSSTLTIRSTRGSPGRCTRTKRTATCTIGTLQAGSTVNVALVVRAARAGRASSIATVTAAADTQPGNNRASLSFLVRASR